MQLVLLSADNYRMAGVIAAFAWLVWRQRPWPAQRRQTLALLATVFAGLTLFAPLTHASVALAILLAGALAEDRRKMLVLVGLVLLAKLSGFYYALRWPLVDKAAQNLAPVREGQNHQQAMETTATLRVD